MIFANVFDHAKSYSFNTNVPPVMLYGLEWFHLGNADFKFSSF